jgi:hypothetical protein
LASTWSGRLTTSADIRAAYDAAPFERHFFWSIWPGVDVEMANASVELFAQQVIPALRDLGEPD